MCFHVFCGNNVSAVLIGVELVVAVHTVDTLEKIDDMAQVSESREKGQRIVCNYYLFKGGNVLDLFNDGRRGDWVEGEFYTTGTYGRDNL